MGKLYDCVWTWQGEGLEKGRRQRGVFFSSTNKRVCTHSHTHMHTHSHGIVMLEKQLLICRLRKVGPTYSNPWGDRFAEWGERHAAPNEAPPHLQKPASPWRRAVGRRVTTEPCHALRGTRGTPAMGPQPLMRESSVSFLSCACPHKSELTLPETLTPFAESDRQQGVG